MWKKFAIGGVAVFVVLLMTLWINRTPILIHLILNRAASSQFEVAANRPIEWDQGPEVAEAPISERPPNIVLIVLDDFGFNDMSLFGGGVAGGRVKTPNIDKLARDGALYTQGYAGTGTCAPSRAMLMTGRYPTRTGFHYTPTPPGFGFAVKTMMNTLDLEPLPLFELNPEFDEGALPFESQGLPTEEITIAELLQEQDYHTVHIGKWHLGRGPGFMPNEQGFDESLLMYSGMYLKEGDPNLVDAILDFDPIDRALRSSLQYAASFNGGEPFEPGGYLTDWWTDESLKVVEANKNRPFFLYMAHWAPHSPLQATKEDFEAVGDIEPHRERVYAAMIRSVDRSIGELMEKLEEEGLADNTIVALTSDNGAPSYIGLPDLNSPYRGWKVTLFEGGIHVPMFVKWPERIEPGTVVDTPVAHIDLFPTFAQAVGAPLPEDRMIDGQDIMVEATGEGLIQRPNDALYWQSGNYMAVRSGGWKLQVDRIQGKTWLFNLAEDPTEQVNLADTHAVKVAQLEKLIDDHQATAVPPLYTHQVVGTVPIDKTILDKYDETDEYIRWPN